MNIKVAVRVRPFNQRELDMGEKACVKMDRKSIMLLSDKGETERTFSYDYCFWSHDGFRSLPDGYNEPQPGSQYADQRYVYNTVGKEIMDNAIKGYNCCLFAYGQTGSGKSYSIFGYGANKGIVPIICDELLNGKTLVNNQKNSFTLSISMLEIYNEKIQDLLIPIAKRPKGGLNIRENPRIGVFVENLSKYFVKTYAEIEEIINSGNKNKTLGATLMNATSSRAHTIITLELITKEVTTIKSTERTAVINLVDLAGSEKVAKTDAQGDRLKEACSINKSLTTLGMVIHQLYLKSEGEKTVVSFRDSALTRMLQNALGGNSKTTMICAVSPARDNYEETLSTLRYADQAKRIKLDAKVNESETDKLIRELTEENEKLKKLLSNYKGGAEMDKIKGSIDEIESAINMRKASKFNAAEATGVAFNPNSPNLINLNEDPLLSGKVVYDLAANPKLIVGRMVDDSEKNGQKRLVLNGVGIQTNHALIESVGGKIFIEAFDSSCAENVFVNGELLTADDKGHFRAQLKDCDRVIIGTSSTFILRMPNPALTLSDPAHIDGKVIDWEFCQMEKFRNQERKERDKFQLAYEEKKQEIAETEARLKKQFEAEREELENRLKKANLEFEMALASLESKPKDGGQSKNDLENENEDVLKTIETEMNKKQQEFQQKLQSLAKETENVKKAQQINTMLEKKLITYYPQIKEANAISSELHRNIIFVPFVSSLDVHTIEDKQSSLDALVKVKVINQEDGWINYWGLEKFESRLQLMRDAIDYFFDYNSIHYTHDNDPFWDPKEFMLFGQGVFIAKNILYRFGIKHTVSMISYEGDLGTVFVNLVPIDEEGKPVDEVEMEELVEEPDDLIKNKLPASFRIEIPKMYLTDASIFLGKHCFIQFEVLDAKGVRTFSTNAIKISSTEVPFNYSQTVTLLDVTYEAIDYYLHKQILVKFMIDEFEPVQKLGKNPPPVLAPKKSVSSTPVPRPITPDKNAAKKNVSIYKEKEKDRKSKSGCTIF